MISYLDAVDEVDLMIRKTSFLATGLIIVFPFLIAIAIEQSKQPADSPGAGYSGEFEQWRAERLKEINGDDGWNTLLGLFWLNQGENRLGSDPSGDIVLPRNRAPQFAGSLWLNGKDLRLKAPTTAGLTVDGAAATDIVLQTDADGGKPTVFKLGSLKLFVIKRGEKFGLRVKDSQSPARAHFAGLDYFPLDSKWRIEARFRPYDPPKTVPIVNVLGMVDEMISPGAAVFEVNGKSYRIDAVLEKGEKHLFFIFADQTTGKETYGAGRYLYADAPAADGKLIVDFNKAHNPPCAFTKFATCPLPPKQNRIALRIAAGEKKYARAGH